MAASTGAGRRGPEAQRASATIGAASTSAAATRSLEAKRRGEAAEAGETGTDTPGQAAGSVS